MFQVVVMTLALTSGDCPLFCARQYHPLYQTFPHCIIGCTGTSCGSCGKGGPCTFDYRNDFNYPWSQRPCALAIHPHAADPRTFEPTYPELIPGGNPSEDIPPPEPSSVRRQSRGRPSVQMARRLQLDQRPSELKAGLR